jgi:sulfate permease
LEIGINEIGGRQMDWTLSIAIAISLFFAMNIGASGAAASMGIAYGSGAVNKRIALIFVSIGVFLGAYLGGGEVVKTLGKGIIADQSLLTVETVIVILIGATLTLFASNLLAVPLSTSEVTVGSIVGVGVAFQSLLVKNILVIVSFWIIVPIAAFLIALISGYGIKYLEKKNPNLAGKGTGLWRKVLIVTVTGAGVFEAFSAGMNNVANAVGPLVGAGLLSADSGLLWGGIFVALGAILLGGRVLDTNGKKITRLSLLQGTTISTTGGALVTLASLYGLPVPLTQVTTTAILGIGVVNQGFKIFQRGTIGKILKVWLVSPLLSMVVSYGLIKIFIEPQVYHLIILLALLISVVGLYSLYKSVLDEKRNTQENGSGI